MGGEPKKGRRPTSPGNCNFGGETKMLFILQKQCMHSFITYTFHVTLTLNWKTALFNIINPELLFNSNKKINTF